MALIFALLVGSILAIAFKRRKIAMTLIVLGLISALGVFWHHLTSVIQINL